jgi:pilus assembly protein Flp/PilA
MKTLSRFFKAQDGATAIEYALIAALIAIVAIVGMKSLGTSISKQFSSVGSTLGSATK